jgi:hypothetical protein
MNHFEFTHIFFHNPLTKALRILGTNIAVRNWLRRDISDNLQQGTDSIRRISIAVLVRGNRSRVKLIAQDNCYVLACMSSLPSAGLSYTRTTQGFLLYSFTTFLADKSACIDRSIAHSLMKTIVMMNTKMYRRLLPHEQLLSSSDPRLKKWQVSAAKPERKSNGYGIYT